jgi:hypothetical protein
MANIAIYWFSGSITSSFWLYYDALNPTGDMIESASAKVDVPSGVGMGRYEIHWVNIKKILASYFYSEGSILTSLSLSFFLIRSL